VSKTLSGWKSAALALAAMVIMASAEVAAQQKLTVGGIIYARDSQFWQQIEKGMRDAAAKYGVDIQIGVNQRKLPTEAQVVEDFVTRGVDILVVPPLDRNASAAAIGRAREKNVLVVEYDTFLEDRTIASHTIGIDSRELAATVGREMRRYVEAKGGAATIGLITLPPTNPNMQPRKQGVLSALEGLKYEVVVEVAGATPEAGANGLEGILQRNSGTTAIWASNAGATAGAAAAARRASTGVGLFGIDMSADLAEMLLDPASNVQAISDQQPYRVGFLSVETAILSKRGTQQPRNVSVPVKLYTKADPAAVKDYLELVRSLAK